MKSGHYFALLMLPIIVVGAIAGAIYTALEIGWVFATSHLEKAIMETAKKP